MNQLKKIPINPAKKLFNDERRAIKQTTKLIMTSIHQGKKDSSIEFKTAIIKIVITNLFMGYHLVDEQNLNDNIYHLPNHLSYLYSEDLQYFRFRHQDKYRRLRLDL